MDYGVEKLKVRISILLVYFTGEDIYQCSDNSSAFQAGIAGASLSAGR
jgi:hypothetical protein